MATSSPVGRPPLAGAGGPPRSRPCRAGRCPAGPDRGRSASASARPTGRRGRHGPRAPSVRRSIARLRALSRCRPRPGSDRRCAWPSRSASPGRAPVADGVGRRRQDGQADDELAAHARRRRWRPRRARRAAPPAAGPGSGRSPGRPAIGRASDRPGTNRSKTCGSSLGGRCRAVVPDARPRRRRTARGRPARSGRRAAVYFAALFSRLPKTCASRTRSPRRTHRPAGRHRDGQRVPAGPRSAAGRSRRPGRRPRRGPAAPAQLDDLAAGDPGDVQQVVDQPGQVLHLALDHVADRRGRCSPGEPVQLEDLDGVAGSGPGGCAARGPSIARNSSLRRSASRRSRTSCSRSSAARIRSVASRK